MLNISNRCNIALYTKKITSNISYGTPFLRSLGLTPELISLVWLAGPLSGLLIQPLVGAISDRCTFKLGRRRPFIIIGGFLVCLSMIGIAYSRELAKIYLKTTNSRNDDDYKEINKAAIYIAVVGFYFLDFSINAVQAACRALILDIPPLYQQEVGNAWAGRMMHIGNVVGYFAGFLDLAVLFPMLGNTQLKILCAIGVIIFILTLLITCLSVKEIVYEEIDDDNKQWWHTLVYIYRAFRYLPVPIQRICNVQFFAWMGWFPFLFYSTTWVAEVYIRSTDDFEEPSDDTLEDSTTRIGSFSLLIYSIVSLLASLILPILVGKGAKSSSESRKQLFQLPKTFVTVPQLWTLSHFIFAFSMLTTWFVTNTFQASILIGLCGISWTTTMWAPYSILGEFITKKSENNQLVMYNLVESETTLEGGDHLDPENGRTSNEETITELPLMDSHGGISTSDSSEAGVIFGIHNTYIVLPEFLITFFNSVVFSILEPGGHSRENLNADAIGFVLRFGGLMTVVAGFLSMKLWKNK